MNRSLFISALSASALISSQALAQDAPQPPTSAQTQTPGQTPAPVQTAPQTAQPQVALPDVTVVVKKKPEQPSKKTARKKDESHRKSASSVAAVVKPAANPTSEPVEAAPNEAQQPETALGPVKGLVATRSATGSKTDTPIVEIPRTVNVVTQDQITEQQPQSVREALGYTPGVQSSDGRVFYSGHDCRARIYGSDLPRWFALTE